MPFTTDEINKLIRKIKPKPTKDVYGLPTNILQKLPLSYIDILCNSFNVAMSGGTYPNVLKEIKVTPVYKGKGSKKELKSYRPISLVPGISKIFEMGLCDRLGDFLQHNGCMCAEQHAYQHGRSTVTAARVLLRTVLLHLEAKQRVAAIFFDLSRAFDLVDHGLISAKLEHYGVRGVGLQMFESFLSDRRQVTQVGRELSEAEPIGNRSVPQGSNVGNNMFLLMMNDLPYESPFVKFIMYADDICAVVNGKDDVELISNIQSVITKLFHWFTANGMHLNVEKTSLLNFSLRLTRAPPLSIRVQDSHVVAVDSSKYVGFTFDRGLQWSQHIDSVCAKLNSAYYAISRLSRTLSKRNLIAIYYAYFHTHLGYGIDLWGLAADRDRPFSMQRKVLRMMCRVPFDEPARPLFKNLSILTVPSMYIMEVAKYIKNRPSEFPAPLKFSARRPHALACPERRLLKSRNSLHGMAHRIYGKIPDRIKDAVSVQGFTRQLKRFLTEKAYFSVQEFLDE